MACRNPLPDLTQAEENSVVQYNWVVIFTWDVDEENPFEVYQRNSFSNGEIPNEWYSKRLGPTCRHQKLKLTGIRGDLFSVFCKIQAGILP